ncbi:TPA: hypothetical protein DEP96_02435 [Candidatus Uhrbacteria bacterium]|nr:hypothetical protein [Candidatus Uhrbacteria bacterium]
MNLYARIRKIEDDICFKRLFDALMTAEYGTDFQSFKQWKDYGIDGYLNTEGTVYQLYCPQYPERTALKNYKEKITEDLEKLAKGKADNKWSKPVNKWIFVTPDDMAVDVVEHIHKEAIRTLGVGESSTITAFNLAPMFLKHQHVHIDFPEITSGIYFDKTPKLQVGFVKNRTYEMVEVFNNGTEDVQDFCIEYDGGDGQWKRWNDHAIYQTDNPTLGHPHTCLNMQKGERQYFNGVKTAGGFNIKVSAVGVESGKTFVLEVNIPLID